MTKFEVAKEAIEEVFGDTSVSESKTRQLLEDLCADIEMKLSCLPE